jgi:signal transduction histidine kinase
MAELLARDLDEMPTKTVKEVMESIVRSGRKMSIIIDELLLLAGARVEKVEKTPQAMGPLIVEAQQRLTGLIQECRAEIIMPDEWPAAVGYGPWIEAVWTNYISNAIKYGGRPPRVELGASVQPNGMVRFWVRDNGTGIKPEHQARLFTPFTRLSNGNGHVKGHGLGLSIVERVVKKLGGQVGVESEVGRGSVFSFTLPAVPQEVKVGDLTAGQF